MRVQIINSRKSKYKLFGFVLVGITVLSVFHILSMSMSVAFNDSSDVSTSVSLSETCRSVEQTGNSHVIEYMQTEKLFSLEKISNIQIILLGKISQNKLSSLGIISENTTKKNVIYDIIVQTPGITLRQIQRKTGFALGVIQYHVNRFEKNDIESLYLGRCKHFFSYQAQFSTTEKTGLAIIRNQKVKSILQCINNENQSYRQKDIVDETGLSKFLVSYYIKQLKQLGIVTQNGEHIKIEIDYQFLGKAF